MTPDQLRGMAKRYGRGMAYPEPSREEAIELLLAHAAALEEVERLKAHAEAMAEVLGWLNRLGGLGYDKHARIEAALVAYRADKGE